MLSIVSFGIEKLAGIGFAKRYPEDRPRLDCASAVTSKSTKFPSVDTAEVHSQIIAAASFSFLIVNGLGTPLSLVQKAGNSTSP